MTFASLLNLGIGFTGPAPSAEAVPMVPEGVPAEFAAILSALAPPGGGDPPPLSVETGSGEFAKDEPNAPSPKTDPTPEAPTPNGQFLMIPWSVPVQVSEPQAVVLPEGVAKVSHLLPGVAEVQPFAAALQGFPVEDPLKAQVRALSAELGAQSVELVTESPETVPAAAKVNPAAVLAASPVAVEEGEATPAHPEAALEKNRQFEKGQVAAESKSKASTEAETLSSKDTSVVKDTAPADSPFEVALKKPAENPRREFVAATEFEATTEVPKEAPDAPDARPEAPSGPAAKAPTTNSDASTNSNGQNQEAPRQEARERIQDRIEHLHATNPRHGVRIEIQPENLGLIELTVRQEGETVQAGIRAEQADVRQALNQALPRLERALEDRGLVVREMSVSSGLGEAPQQRQGQPQPQSNSKPFSTLARAENEPVTTGFARSTRGLDLAI